LTNPKAGGLTLIGCLRPLIQYIRSCLHFWRPYLRPLPEDAPCRGDMEPHNTLKGIPKTVCRFLLRITSPLIGFRLHLVSWC